MFSYRIFESGSDKMLAVCDKELLGKTFVEGDVEIVVSREFYGDKEAGTDILKIARKSTIINAIGRNIVSLLIEEEIVDESSVISLGSVPHAQVVSV